MKGCRIIHTSTASQQLNEVKEKINLVTLGAIYSSACTLVELTCNKKTFIKCMKLLGFTLNNEYTTVSDGIRTVHIIFSSDELPRCSVLHVTTNSNSHCYIIGIEGDSNLV